MTKLKNPLLSLNASGSLSKVISFVKRQKQNLAEKKPEVKDVKSAAQLSWRHMYLKCAALWHDLSAAEQADWNSLGGIRHMTGFAYWQSQCLRPNPGIYLPLQGGTMQGIIDMDGFAIQDLLDPAAAQDADTKAARDAAIAAAIGGSLDCDIHGYDGLNWQKLLVESAALHNLRVRLYAGATPISAGTRAGIAVNPTLGMSLDVAAFPHLMVTGTDWRGMGSGWLCVDGHTGVNNQAVAMMGYNGATFDRLRSYATGILKVARAEAGITDLRRIVAGQVKASAGKLYWITMNPNAANSIMELTDDLNGLGAVKWDMTHGANSAHHMNFDPPLEFATGIYLKTLTNFTSAIFGYL